MKPNGQRSENTSREEGRKEGSQGFRLQQSPSATDGSDDRKERSQGLLIHLENSSQDRTILLPKGKTLEDVRQGIFREVPGLSSSKLIVEFFNEPKTSGSRVPLKVLPSQSELYATVYLFKH